MSPEMEVKMDPTFAIAGLALIASAGFTEITLRQYSDKLPTLRLRAPLIRRLNAGVVICGFLVLVIGAVLPRL
jgi:hypothetical protein